jgi:hypothetical protein
MANPAPRRLISVKTTVSQLLETHVGLTRFQLNPIKIQGCAKKASVM